MKKAVSLKLLKLLAAGAMVLNTIPAVTVLAEEDSPDDIAYTTYENAGYTFEKVSHAKSPVESPDGIVDYFSPLQITENTNGTNENADSVQSYTYCAVSHGDWVYMGTMYGALSAYTQVENAVASFGASEEVAKAVVDVMFNGRLNKGREEDGIPAGSVFFKFNVKTGETKILMSRTLYNQGKCDGVPIFRSAAEYNGKLYFVGLVSDGRALAGQSLYGMQIPDNPAMAINYEINMQNGVPCVYEVDPENDDKLEKVLQCVSVDGYRALNNRMVFTSTRAIDTFTATKADGTKEEWLLAGGLADTTQGEPYGVEIMATQNPAPVVNDYYETDLSILHGSWKAIADQNDLCGYPAIVRADSEGGGGLYQVIQYGENTVYTAIVTGHAATNEKERTFAVVKGVYDPEKGEVNDHEAWTWTPVIGDQNEGARYTFGIDPSRHSSGACTLEVYGDYLYIGEYNDVNYSLMNVLTDRSFRILAKNLTDSINLYRMDHDENIEMVVGDPTEMFPEAISGWKSGYETHMTQYTWMTTVVNDTMYLSTMDETSLTHVLAQLVNGELLNMSREEWSSQLNYMLVLIKLLEKDIFPSASLQTLQETDEETAAEMMLEQAIAAANYEVQMSVSLYDDDTDPDFSVPEVVLTKEQRQKLIKGILDGSIIKGIIDDEDATNLAAIARQIKELEKMLDETVSEEFADAYDSILELISDYITSSDSIPADIKGMFGLLFSFVVSENLGYLKTCLSYMKDSVAGFDLYEIKQAEDGSVAIRTITNNGFNDRYNHGLRIFTTVPGYMVVGTANPFYGAQIWRTPMDIKDKEPEVTPDPEDPDNKDPEVTPDPENPDDNKDPEVTPDPENPDDNKDPEVKPVEKPEEEQKPAVKPSTGVNTGDSFHGGILGGIAAAFAAFAAAVWFALERK